MSKKTVWKYPITVVTDQQTLEMPEGAEILDVQVQRGSASIWAVVDPAMPKVTRHFVIVGTGQDMPEQAHDAWRLYIGTFQLDDGHLVLHLFEDVAT